MVVVVGDEEQNKLRFNMSSDELDVFRLATDACGSASRRRRARLQAIEVQIFFVHVCVD